MVQLSQQASNALALSNLGNVKGIIAVTLATITSGLAGTLVEKLLKSSNSDLWIRNGQISLIGFLMSVVGCFVNDRKSIISQGILYGYTPIVWGVITLQAIGGLVMT